jgi:flagellar biosynthesis GTPase FlhF
MAENNKEITNEGEDIKKLVEALLVMDEKSLENSTASEQNSQKQVFLDINDIYIASVNHDDSSNWGYRDDFKAMSEKIIKHDFNIGIKAQRQRPQNIAKNFIIKHFDWMLPTNLKQNYKHVESTLFKLSIEGYKATATTDTAAAFLAACITYKIAKLESQANKIAIAKDIKSTIMIIVDDDKVKTFYHSVEGSASAYLLMLAYAICTQDDESFGLRMGMDFYFDRDQFNTALSSLFCSAMISNITHKPQAGLFVLHMYKNKLMKANPQLSELEKQLIAEYNSSELTPIIPPVLSKTNIVSDTNQLYGTFKFYWTKDENEAKDIFFELMTKEKVQKITNMKLEFPNFHEVLGFIEQQAKLSLINQKPFNFPPICLKGPSGTGKTAFCIKLAVTLSLPKLLIHSAQITCGSILTGLQKTWNSSSQGMVTQLVNDTSRINPIVFIDEFHGLINKPYSNGIPAENALNSLLDPAEAKNFVDGCTRCPVDLSRVSWIFAANHLNGLDEALKKRIRVFDIEQPKSSDTPIIARNLYKDAISEMDVSNKISFTLDELSLQAIVMKIQKGMDYRTAKNWLKDVVMTYSMDNFETVHDANKAELIVPLKYFN